MLLTRDKIERIIPQQVPFVMLDNLLEAKENKIITEFKILSDNIFLENGILREFALIENIAQSCAAGLVYIRSEAFNGQNKIDGFIGAISKLKISNLPKLGDKIVTHVYLLNEFENLFLLKGEVFCNNEIVLEGEFKIAGK